MSARRAAKPKPSQDFLRAEAAAKFILRKTKLRPRIGLVLGSGLGAFANEIPGAARIEYGSIPNFPRSTAIGHAGRMVIGNVADVPVAVMQGRVHFYEGYSMRDVIFPMRVMSRMGIRAVLLTNAAGGISTNFKQGCLVVLRDHINLQGTNPLIGPNDENFGERFPDMTSVYWKPYQAVALREGKRLGIEMFEGIYAALTGPSYETPAEIRYLRGIGADLIGMSTVPEVIAAAHLGIRVLGISCVTNMAAGILDQPITSEEVMETGERVKADFVALLRAVIPRMNEDLP
ncbi:MAG TPA: purine-nucleoside phosphorylase [Candidatus Sulfotelmatobacter sp.]|jgi:purine-nucleoside phosphorylase|nr:purine-nucleoside phosphorylase [Candidatus Sulfotelmatobacter sp.]